MFEVDPSKVEPDADSFFRDAAAYYGTKRGEQPRFDHRVPSMSYDLMVSFDSFNLQHFISPRSLLVIAGSDAQTLHYSRTPVNAAGELKEFFEIHGTNHFDLYDDPKTSGQTCGVLREGSEKNAHVVAAFFPHRS